MATAAQVRANQQNSLRSTGPVTPEGKAASRRNALTHGLTATGDTLPGDDALLVADQEAAYRVRLRPVGPEEEGLVRQIAADGVRQERCWTLFRTLVARHAARARDLWDDDRRAEAEDVAARLPRDPARASRALAASAQGCALMIERWEALGRILETSGSWTEAQKSMALDLLGVHPDLRDGASPLDGPGADPGAVAASELDRLRTRKADRLDDWDAGEREIAEAGLGAEMTRPLQLLHRYESAVHRRWSAALRHFLARDRGAPGLAPVPAPAVAPTHVFLPPPPPPPAATPRQAALPIGPRLVTALGPVGPVGDVEDDDDASEADTAAPAGALPGAEPRLSKRERRRLSKLRHDRSRR